MSRPHRSKRNFKALQLDVTTRPEPPEADPVPTRQAPSTKPAGGGGKKRPPPMNLKPKTAADAPAAADGPGGSLLSVSQNSASAPLNADAAANVMRMTYHTMLSNKLASLDITAEVKYDLRDEDLNELNELGQGNGGSVKKVEHLPTHTIMAKVPVVDRHLELGTAL